MDIGMLEPRECFKWFAAIAAIPRCSNNEQGISDWLVTFAGVRDLFVCQDQAGNICIRKPASKGMENAPAVILQGHMDMVCVKKNGSLFDFRASPIALRTDGEWLRADGTTLGADNGIAVAFILALLDSKDIPHPPLEAVITVEEEVGMNGAAVFDVSLLSGSFFINLDSEKEGVFCTSCAGGRRSMVSLPAPSVAVSDIPGLDGYRFFRITLGGLAGGHSGIDIEKQRGNANRLMGRALGVLLAKYDGYLAHIAGGTAMNVIPSSCSAEVLLACDTDTLNRELGVLCGMFRRELLASDGSGLSLAAEPASGRDTVFARDVLPRVVAALTLLPDGVVSMDLNMTAQRLVESSSNLAVVATEEDAVVITCLTRSSVESRKIFICDQIGTVASLLGATVAIDGDHPAWQYAPESKLRDVFRETYAALFGREAKVEGVHAGLECGLFLEKFRNLGMEVDCIALGPTITGAHTVNEAVEISSVGNTWKLLLEVLRRLGDGEVKAISPRTIPGVP